MIEGINNPSSSFILVFTIAVSLIALFANPKLIDQFILSPYTMIQNGEYFRCISYSFLHTDLGHLFFNMFSFYSFSFILERAMGSSKFMLLYFGSVVLSVVSSIIKNKDNPEYKCVGASGGVSGVIFSFILFQPNAKLSLMFIPIPVPAYIFGLLYLAYSFYSSKSDDRINHEAHFYGALAGIAITILFFPNTVSFFFKQIGV